MYTVFDVANYFLSKEPMTHKKLQKLCYYTQAWSFALKNKPFINDDFEAWVHGPVCRTLYNKYSYSGMEDLCLGSKAAVPMFTPSESEFLDSVWETYGEHTGNALEVLSHSEPPWICARAGLDAHEPCSVKIDPELMKSYYLSIYDGDLSLEA
ncbi:MAG: DUF4065 domain-containing protein [Oscillospiraceae bacterium]|nr:DUF4065 domain-containing protein [Oscillospiraceae bacterium]